MRWRRERNVLNEGALMLMQIQLDKLEAELRAGDRAAVEERRGFWRKCAGMAMGPAARVYWEHLVEHGDRLVRLTR